ncbi:hypothetical protein [Nocardiopsis trehalosi]|uniref:hypothetical protein n=1 Tax=Nocardiopsis trehalosi TaxID=109329 RepID=UPI000835C0DE|nr:hypothetical protein [Nocardiopsis trehalosi]
MGDDDREVDTLASEYEELSKRAKENPASLSDAEVERFAVLAQQQSVAAQQKSTEQARRETGLELPLHDYAGLSNKEKEEIAKKAAEERAAAGRSGSQPRRRGRRS